MQNIERLKRFKVKLISSIVFTYFQISNTWNWHQFVETNVAKQIKKKTETNVTFIFVDLVLMNGQNKWIHYDHQRVRVCVDLFLINLCHQNKTKRMKTIQATSQSKSHNILSTQALFFSPLILSLSKIPELLFVISVFLAINIHQKPKQMSWLINPIAVLPSNCLNASCSSIIKIRNNGA